jgi:hypothetical protein
MKKSIITTRKLKIYSIVFHALIIIGAGHGIIIMGILGLVGLVQLFMKHSPDSSFIPSDFSFSFHATFESRMPVVIIFIVAGQLLMLISIFNVELNRKLVTHITSLICLWLSLIYISCGNSHTNRDEVYVSYLSAVPFAICTCIAFLGKPVKKLGSKIWEMV